MDRPGGERASAPPRSRAAEAPGLEKNASSGGRRPARQYSRRRSGADGLEQAAVATADLAGCSNWTEERGDTEQAEVDPSTRRSGE
jgi:hypothetical protein